LLTSYYIVVGTDLNVTSMKYGDLVRCKSKVWDCRHPKRQGYALAHSVGKVVNITTYYEQTILHVRLNQHCMAKLNSEAVILHDPTSNTKP
jgi:hypothetical protein